MIWCASTSSSIQVASISRNLDGCTNTELQCLFGVIKGVPNKRCFCVERVVTTAMPNWIEIWSSLGRPSCEWFCSLPLWQSTWKLQLRPHRSWFPHPYVSNNPQSHGFYLFFCLFFVDVTRPFSFRRFCWCLAVHLTQKKQNTNRHVSRSMSPKLSAPHSISPWRLRWLFQMRNIWNLRSKPQDLRSKPHQIWGPSPIRSMETYRRGGSTPR